MVMTMVQILEPFLHGSISEADWPVRTMTTGGPDHKFCTSDRVESVEAVGEREDVLLRDQGAHALVALPAIDIVFSAL